MPWPEFTLPLAGASGELVKAEQVKMGREAEKDLKRYCSDLQKRLSVAVIRDVGWLLSQLITVGKEEDTTSQFHSCL